MIFLSGVSKPSCVCPQSCYSNKHNTEEGKTRPSTRSTFTVLAQVAISKRVKCKLMLDDC